VARLWQREIPLIISSLVEDEEGIKLLIRVISRNASAKIKFRNCSWVKGPQSLLSTFVFFTKTQVE